MARIAKTQKWWNWKWWLIFAGVFFVACALVGYGMWYAGAWQNKWGSHQFVGQIVSINDNQIEALGFHVIDLDATKSDYAHPQHVTVNVDPSTVFVKIIWHMLSKEDLAKTDGKFDPSMVSREQKAGSLEDLQNSKAVSITVKTKEDSLNANVLNASEIDYNVQVYPTPSAGTK